MLRNVLNVEANCEKGGIGMKVHLDKNGYFNIVAETIAEGHAMKYLT